MSDTHHGPDLLRRHEVFHLILKLPDMVGPEQRRNARNPRCNANMPGLSMILVPVDPSFGQKSEAAIGEEVTLGKAES